MADASDASDDAFVPVSKRKAARAKQPRARKADDDGGLPYSVRSTAESDPAAAAAAAAKAVVAEIEAQVGVLSSSPLGIKAGELALAAAGAGAALLCCYGAGSVEDSRRSRAQLALFVHLRRVLGTRCLGARVCDPAMTAADHEIVRCLGLEVLADNARGQLCLLDEENEPGGDKRLVALMYMPHCPLELYNAVLWAHWTPAMLARLVILGNSFEHYRESRPDRHLRAAASYLADILPATRETSLQGLSSGGHAHDVFNELAVHEFRPDGAGSLDWTRIPASQLPVGPELA